MYFYGDYEGTGLASNHSDAHVISPALGVPGLALSILFITDPGCSGMPFAFPERNRYLLKAVRDAGEIAKYYLSLARCGN